MNYTIVGSLRSPYTRRLRMFLFNSGIDFTFKVVNYLENKEDTEYLAKLSPINKIPILISYEGASSVKVFDSRIIANYVTKKHNLRSLTLDEENNLSAIDGANDASANMFLLRHGGLDLNTPNTYLERQKARVEETLQFLSPWVRTLDPDNKIDWNFATQALFSYLYWGRARQFLDLEKFEEMPAFLDRFKKAPGVVETHVEF